MFLSLLVSLFGIGHSEVSVPKHNGFFKGLVTISQCSPMLDWTLVLVFKRQHLLTVFFLLCTASFLNCIFVCSN